MVRIDSTGLLPFWEEGLHIAFFRMTTKDAVEDYIEKASSQGGELVAIVDREDICDVPYNSLGT